MSGGDISKAGAWARVVGSFLGFALGAAVLLRLAAPSADRRAGHRSEQVVPSAGVEAQVEVARLREVTNRQREELRRLRDVAVAESALEQSGRSIDPEVAAPASAETVEDSDISRQIDAALGQAVIYLSTGNYSPQVHALLYRRLNLLWDIRGLRASQNESLGRVVSQLNEVAVQHAERVFAAKDDAAVIATVAMLGKWAFRLTDQQKRRLDDVVRGVRERESARQDKSKALAGPP